MDAMDRIIANTSTAGKVPLKRQSASLKMMRRRVTHFSGGCINYRQATPHPHVPDIVSPQTQGSKHKAVLTDSLVYTQTEGELNQNKEVPGQRHHAAIHHISIITLRSDTTCAICLQRPEHLLDESCQRRNVPPQ